MSSILDPLVDGIRNDAENLSILSRVNSARVGVRDETKEDRREAELRRVVQKLQKRVNELDCLQTIFRLLENFSMPLGQTLQEAVPLIPPAFRFPESACARIIVDGTPFAADGWVDTPWKQTAPIRVHNEHAGTIEVCYREEKPKADRGPFLKEEGDLLEMVAERLGNVIARRWAEAELTQARKEAEKAVQVKNEFLINISDELRSPLSAILGFADIITRTVSDAKAIEAGKIIKHHSEHLLELIDNLFSIPNKGSKFVFTIPAKLPEHMQSPPHAEPPTAFELPAGETPQSVTDPLNHRVLVVEGDAKLRRLFAGVLEQAGAQVSRASTSQEAVDAFLAAKAQRPESRGGRAEPFDIVLMDMQMPDQDGYHATRRLRKEGYRGPIIALSPPALKDDRKQYRDAGCDDWIAQPLTKNRLLHTVRQAANSYAKSEPGSAP